MNKETLSTEECFYDRFVKVWHELIESPAKHTLRYSQAGDLLKQADAEIKRLRAALQRIDDHLVVRPGSAVGDLQVSGGHSNSISFWLALKAARAVLRGQPKKPEPCVVHTQPGHPFADCTCAATETPSENSK